MLVKIRDIRCKAYLGLFDWERRKKRNIVFHITYSVKDQQKTPLQILDYDKLTEKILEFLHNNSFQLIENLTHDLTKHLAFEKNIEWIEVECLKPDALMKAQEISVVCKKIVTENE